jgi:hypothetical protein
LCECHAAVAQAKVQITDADLVSGKFATKLAKDLKRDDTNGKATGSDDRGDKGSWTTDDSGDGATDIGDRRRNKNAD